MSTKSRNLLITVAVVVLSVMVWGVVAAQDATAEPNPAATAEANPMVTAEPNMSGTAEANPSDMTAHPFLGVSLQDGTDGVTVAEVVDGSAAATAGIKVGDMITAIDGTKVTTAAEAAGAVATHKVGDSVTVDLTRDGSSMTVSATLGTQPVQMPMRPGQGRGNGNGNGNGNNGNGNSQFPPNFAPMMPFLQYAYGNGHLGVTFQNLDADVAKTNNLTITDGALVTEVEAGSPAEKAGLKVNDVITAVDGDKVDQERTLRDRLIAYEPGDVVTLTIQRDGASQDIQATLDEPQMPTMNGNFPFNFQGPHGFRFGQPDQNGQNNPEATPEATPNL